MSGFTVFYAWQSDLPRDVSKNFIHDAAQQAIEKLTMGMQLEDSPRLDQDTQGIPGIPSIGDTIMRKISACSAFIADVSLVGELIDKTRAPKVLPNPNVMIELGYAWGRIDWHRLILVMNDVNGGLDKLPFDLRHRREPYMYTIDADKRNLASERKKLAKYLQMALLSMVNEEHQQVTEMIRKLDGYAMHIIRKYSASDHFWEIDASQNELMGAHSAAIIRLLDLGVTQVTSLATTPSGFAYTWTYLGRLVIRRLALPEPPPIKSFDVADPPVNLVTDFSMLDKLLNETREVP